MLTFTNRPLPLGPEAPLAEILLAETAIRIELPPSLHQLSVDRYEAVRKHVERPGSFFAGRVTIFYPQGSMAIGATIKSRERDDGFDIDIVAELIVPLVLTPAQVLDALFNSINGPPGSKYHGKVERQTRCVTVYYDDGMHLDITPSCLLDEGDPRLSVIFHAKPEEPVTRHKSLPINSFGFCKWLRDRTPLDVSFAEGYRGRQMAFDRQLLKSAAVVVPVPAHSKDAGGKSAIIVALQLLKRNRNIHYAGRKGRMPPSVMISCVAGMIAESGLSISDALQRILSRLLTELEDAERNGMLIDIRNPVCDQESFTDRWPENRAAQMLYITDLKRLQKQLDMLHSDRLDLAQKADLLAEMFGEGPTRAVVRDYAATLGRAVSTGNRSIGSSGRVIPTTIFGTAVGASPAMVRASGHTFYGSSWKPR